FPRIDLFDRVVAENGAVLYRPETREEKVLAEAPSPGFVAELRRRGVDPIAVGRAIVATWEPHRESVLAAIRALGLDLHVIGNKRAIMVLPAGVDKATGLAAALDELGLAPRDVVGIGDAENDCAFLASCGLGVAVANALPALQERADLVTQAGHGAGVVELIARMLDDALPAPRPRPGPPAPGP
ncbi:MAG TPA: HAD hydrolase family protein, partial [Isosphaeraceae bacterium]